MRCYKKRPLVLSFHILTMAKRDNLEFENSDNDDFQETFGTAILGQQEARHHRDWNTAAARISTIHRRSFPKNKRMQLRILRSETKRQQLLTTVRKP